MSNKCKKCGMCCACVTMPVGMDYIDEILSKFPFDEEYILYKKNLIPIDKKEAYIINPHLETWNMDPIFFFKCNEFDEKNNICKIYNNRPRMCSEYPLYDNKKVLPKKYKFYQKNCGFKECIEK